MAENIGSFEIDVRSDGIAIVTFNRPPVNAVSISVYENLGELVTRCEADPAIRVVILTANEKSRAWCGGADLNDFVGIDADGRKERYSYINAQLPRLYNMEKPLIAAINGHAVGVGVILAALCDMRVASEDALFSCPEIDYGLVAGGTAIFALTGISEAKIREMLFTGQRFSARDLEPTGFFNYVVPAGMVVEKAMDIARAIASKSLPAIRARKIASTNMEARNWIEAYLYAQALSAELTLGRDGAEGVNAFLSGRKAQYLDQ